MDLQIVRDLGRHPLEGGGCTAHRYARVVWAATTVDANDDVDDRWDRGRGLVEWGRGEVAVERVASEWE